MISWEKLKSFKHNYSDCNQSLNSPSQYSILVIPKNSE